MIHAVRRRVLLVGIGWVVVMIGSGIASWRFPVFSLLWTLSVTLAVLATGNAALTFDAAVAPRPATDSAVAAA